MSVMKLNLMGLFFAILKVFAMRGGRHFASLYSDTECDSYDNTHFVDVTARSNSIKVAPIVDSGDHISQVEVLSALSTLIKALKALLV